MRLRCRQLLERIDTGRTGSFGLPYQVLTLVLSTSYLKYLVQVPAYQVLDRKFSTATDPFFLSRDNSSCVPGTNVSTWYALACKKGARKRPSTSSTSRKDLFLFVYAVVVWACRQITTHTPDFLLAVPKIKNTCSHQNKMSIATPTRRSMEGEETTAADRTALVAARLKQLYTKHVLPVEKRYQYEFFYESPYLSDVEFDGTWGFRFLSFVISFWIVRVCAVCSCCCCWCCRCCHAFYWMK